MPDILAEAVYAYACLYALFAVLIVSGMRRFRTGFLHDDPPPVSIVVCARNEEKDIGRCIMSLKRLKYPAEKLEIIIVDDESGDRTVEIVRRLIAGDDRFRLLSTKGEPRDLPAKQRPMNLGIMSASHEIVLSTDADCAVKPGWVWSHVTALDERTGIAGGVTRISTESGSLFDRLQNSDLVSKLGVVMGCAGLGIPLTVMGNNISFRRSAYIELGGFRKIAPSIVEDMALMNAIRMQAGYNVGWARGDDGVVVSTPEERFTDLVEQRRRWIHEIGDLSMIGKLMISVESIMLAAFFVSVVLAVLGNPLPLVMAGCVWMAGIASIIASTPSSRFSDVLAVPGMLLFQMVYGIVLGIRTLVGGKDVVWKGRVYGKRDA